MGQEGRRGPVGKSSALMGEFRVSGSPGVGKDSRFKCTFLSLLVLLAD